MSGSVELGVGYLSVVPETSKVIPGIDKALTGAQANADRAGQGMGSKIAGGIGTTLKFGAATAGAAAAGVIGTALTQGMARVVAIDDAKGKLAGLGHTAEGVTTIMDSALASVKGTAFGLGDAAGIAASAVAAGIKPGEELTKYLTLTGDAATIAGSSLEEMGSIFNKVQTSGKAYTDNLNQLADRGIPIFQWLQDEYGVTAEELSKMVKEGKVDAETFNKVIQENIGGAALESGKTLRGSFANMKAALGRAGAAVIEPFLPMMKAGLGKVMEFTDKVTPHLKAGAEKAAAGLTDMGRAFMSSGDSIEGPATKMERFGVKAREVVDGIKGVWSILSKGEFAGSKMTFGLEEDSKTVEILFKIREGLQGIKGLFAGDDAGDVGAMFAKLSQSGGDAEAAIDGLTGAAGENKSVLGQLWEVTQQVGTAVKGAGISLVQLGGDSVTVAASGLRVVGNTMGFLADHSTTAQVAVVGLAGAMLSIKATTAMGNIGRFVQAIQAPANWIVQRQLTAALNENSAAMRANIAAMGGVPPAAAQSTAARIRDAAATRAQSAAARIGAATTVTSSQALVRFATAQRLAATSNGVFVGGMRQATASAAIFGARVQSAGTAALGGMRTAASGLAGFMTGPWGIAMAAAAVGYLAFSNSGQDAAQRTDEIRSAVSDLATTLHDSGGAYTTAGQSAAAAALESIKLADSSDTLSQTLENVGVSARTAAAGLAGNADALRKTREELAAQAGSELDIWGGLTDVKMPDFSLKSILGQFTIGGQSDYAKDTFTKDNPAGAALKAYDEAEAAIKEKQESLKRVAAAGGDANVSFDGTTASLGTMAQAMNDFKSSTGGAAEKIDILSGGLAKLRGDQFSAEEAQKKVNDAIRGFGEAAAGAGASVDEATGKIDTSTAAGSRLFDSMMSVRSAFDDAGAQARTAAAEQKLSTGDAAAAVEAAGQRIRDDFIRQAMEADYSRAAAEALANQYGLLPKELVTNVKLTGTVEAQAAITDFINRNTGISVDIMANVIAPGPSNAPAASLGDFMMPGRAEGGPITGGIPGKDSVPILAMPGEHVLTTADVDRLGGQAGAYRFRAALAQGKVGKFAAGGAVGEAVDAARSVTGVKYKWGGVGPDGFDCSGFVGWLQQILMGFGKATSRIYTTYSLIGGATAGLAKGLNSASPFNVGVSEEHMAATLDGQPVESGGSHGDSRIGAPAVGANDGQFPYKFHLPLDKIAGGYSPGSGTSANQYSSGESTWTEKDDLALESARVSIQQAKEARDKVYANEKKSDADRQQADLRVQRAEQRVIDLEAKREGAGSAKSYGPAPDLPGDMTDEAMELRNAEIAVTEAEIARDRAYGEADSTSIDKEKADMAVYAARNRLSETQKKLLEEGDKSGDKSRLKTFAEIGSDLGGILANGLLETFGLQDSLLADPNKFFVDNTGPTGARTTEPLKKPKPLGATPATEIVAPPTMTISLSEAMTQLPFTPDWNDPLGTLKKLSAFDQGGEASGLGFMPKAILEPERVLSPRTTQDFNRLVGVLDRGDVLNDFESGNQRGGGSTTYAPTFTGLLDEEQMFSMFERWQRRTQTGGGQRTVAHRSRRR